MNQTPLRASISRSIGAGVCSTVRASASSASSAASELKIRERPADVAGITLNSDRVAGVKKRMFRSVSRKSVATSVLYRTFCRSLEVVRCRSSVSWSWLLSAVSSSFSDCSSSFEVSSSSLVDWYSSLTDSASSLIAFCSSLEISRLRIAPCSSVRVASSSCSSSATRGSSRRRDRAGSLLARCAARRRSRSAAGSSPSLVTGWTSMLNAPRLPSSVRRAARHHDVRVRPGGLLDRGSEPGAHVRRAPSRADHG